MSGLHEFVKPGIDVLNSLRTNGLCNDNGCDRRG